MLRLLGFPALSCTWNLDNYVHEHLVADRHLAAESGLHEKS